MRKKQSLEEGGKETELQQLEGSIVQNRVAIEAGMVDVLTSRGYGVVEDGVCTLNVYEALYLVSKGMLTVSTRKQRGQTLGFEQLLHEFRLSDADLWVKYIVYRDWRSRGYVVREGFGLDIDFRVYERGTYGKKPAAYLVLNIQEGKPIPVMRLTQVLRHVQSLKKKLVLSVVNRRGEVVYYSLSKLTMK
ncbi:MAG: tRNA-intron lyase [Candidatus Bathyarchaeota archaeon]|nr:MAG: tRNA-intron lyase [Candidatus Bathyarchaeota archaeon]